MSNFLNELFNLNNKVAVITGAGGHLCSEMAKGLAKVGCKIVVIDIRKEKAEQVASQIKNDIGVDTLAIQANASNRVEVNKSLEKILNHFKKVDILINGAGINSPTPFLEIELEEFNEVMNSQITSTLVCSQVFGRTMALDGKGGVILNISSDLSVISPDQRLYRKNGIEDSLQPVKPVTYSVIKAGLIGLTKYLATYWADKGVRCNALSPGGVYNGQGDDFVGRLTSLIPLGRMANLEEYRSSIQYMCSDASSYMNGQNIVIDGGRSIW